MIEKPVAINKTELQAMYATISQAKIKTVISFVLRWNPLILSIKEIVAKGWIGKPLLVQADYWHGPTNINPKRFHKNNWVPMNIGAIVHGGCHAMDAARYVLGNAKIVQVSGTMPTYSVPSHIIKPLTMASVNSKTVQLEKYQVQPHSSCRTCSISKYLEMKVSFVTTNFIQNSCRDNVISGRFQPSCPIAEMFHIIPSKTQLIT